MKQEAILNCYDKTRSSFLCILGLSSVIGRKIHSHYPDCRDIRPRLLFNQVINPHSVMDETNVHVLFCFLGGVKAGESFTPNHFVPLLCVQKIQKQTQISKKHKKLESSKHNKTSKKVKLHHSRITRFFQVDEKHKVIINLSMQLQVLLLLVQHLLLPVKYLPLLFLPVKYLPQLVQLL